MSVASLRKFQVTSNFSHRESYDLIVIGAGISGLSTGALWLKNRPDSSVLVVEKEPHPGGYVTAYKRRSYIFETTQLLPDIRDLLKYMGISLLLKQYEDIFLRRIVVDGDDVGEYYFPIGLENFTSYLMKEFSEDARRIERFLNYARELFSQVGTLKASMTLAEKIIVPFTAPKVVANLNKTFAQLLDKFGIVNARLRGVLETFTIFAGVPPSRASAIYTIGVMFSMIRGPFRPMGYFDELPAAMASTIQALGGELLFRTTVEKIVVKNGSAGGIKIAGENRVIGGDRIVTTVDSNVAMHELVGDENLPSAYVKKLRKTAMSCSSLNVSLGLDDAIDPSKANLDYPYTIISTPTGTTEKLFGALQKGENAFSEHCFHMGVACPSLTTGGKTTLTLRGVPFGPGMWKTWRENDPGRYREEKDQWGDFFIALAEKYLIPGLKNHIVVKDISTPATYARYSGSPTGSIYDMELSVNQFGPKRLPVKTPIVNLYQPKFGHGIYGCVMGGVQVVDLLLDRAFNGGNTLFDPVR